MMIPEGMNREGGQRTRAAWCGRLRRALSPRRFARCERGAQFIEVAITLPLMLALLGATAEFANFFYHYTTLTNAVRQGARHASKWEVGASWTIPETQRMVVYGDYSNTSKGPILPGLTTANVKVTANGPSSHAIQSVTVSIVNYKYKPLLDLGKFTGIQGLSLKIDLKANATMKQLFNGPVMTELRERPAGGRG